MPKAWMPSGAVPLALPERYNAEVSRLVLAGRRAWQGAVRPGLIDQAGEAITRMVSGADLPAQPIGSAAEVPAFAEGEGEVCDAGFTLVGDVALIAVSGVLSPCGYYDYWDEQWVGGYRQIVQATTAALADPRVAAVIHVHDTPGGLVSGGDDAARALRALRDGSDKPLVVFANFSCSMGMWLGAQSDGIFAPRDANVGSIGVRMGFFDHSGWLERVGDTRHEFVSGRLKDMGTPFRAPTEEEAGIFQTEINHLAARFYTQFAAGRGSDLAQLTDTNGFEAQVFTVGAAETGNDEIDPLASGAGIIDAQMSFEDAFAAVRSMAGSRSGALGRASAGFSPDPRNGPDQESDAMKLQAQIAALQTRAANGDQCAQEELDELRGQLAMNGEEEEASDEEGVVDDDEASDEEEDKDEQEASDEEEASADEEAPGGEEEEASDEDPAALADAVVAEATKAGKTALGAKLGIKVASGKMSAADARDLLASSPREKSPVRDALASGRSGAAPTGAAPETDEAGAALAQASKRFHRRR